MLRLTGNAKAHFAAEMGEHGNGSDRMWNGGRSTDIGADDLAAFPELTGYAVVVERHDGAIDALTSDEYDAEEGE